MRRKSNTQKNTYKSKENNRNKSSAKRPKKSGRKPLFKIKKPGTRTRQVAGLTLLLISFLLLLSFVSHIFTWKGDFSHLQITIDDFFGDTGIRTENIIGKLGAVLSHIFITKWFGIPSFMFVLMFIVTGVKWVSGIRILPEAKLYRHCIFLIIWLSATLGFIFRSGDALILGGTFGYQSREWLSSMFGQVGTGFILFFIFILYLLLSFRFMVNLLQIPGRKAAGDTSDKNTTRAEDQHTVETDPDTEAEDESSTKGQIDFITGRSRNEGDQDDPDETTTGQKNEIELSHEAPLQEPSSSGDIEMTVEQPADENNGNQEEEENKEHYKLDTPYDPTLELRDYQFPDTDLLEVHGSDMISVEKEELETNKNKILNTLNNYNIEISKIKATIGPTITLYEIVPAPGVRISKIKNLEDDIALSLSALGIRIIAPIPGRGTIGIEVPNQNPETVSMRTVIQSSKFKNSKYALPVAIGKTISNESYVFDLSKMPHLLMAGATGQGKSVGLNAIITSLLYKKHPSQLKFVMVDPKKVELSLFSKIERHYLAKLPDSEEAIITDVQKVVKTLNSLTVEMDQRYELLKNAHVRNIKEYNTKFVDRKLNPEEGHRYLPYIVLIVDEFADLIMTAGKEVESPIARLAQLARAVGIHLIIATQRPSVNIITGVIKANFPARIAFRVTSKVDSRTILDASGADQLIGRGDMLLSTGNDLLRLQCAFVDTPEVDDICDFIGSQRAYESAFILPEVKDETGSGNGEISDDERDDLFEEAARVIVKHQHGSTSLLQRKLKLGYNRAGRIIDQLEAAGIVGPFEGSKAREVKIPDETTLEQYLESER
ncbi:MAG: DNA translocase FtsK [Bacteroidales bacterium]|nr:DNA translocase FtsK [Bacteroidales bacterium]